MFACFHKNAPLVEAFGSFCKIFKRSRLWARYCWTLKQIQMLLNAQTIRKQEDSSLQF